MRPETTASCGKLARGADTGMWVSGGFRDTCRRALAAGLYHTRLLQGARLFPARVGRGCGDSLDQNSAFSAITA